MEENKNRQNTLLLTIIAVATLLVAVIGATFAYFSANISGEEGSTVIVNSATLTIAFSDNGGSTVAPAAPIEPTKESGGTYAASITKNFKLVGNNDTGTGSQASPAKFMPYELYLIVTKNNFVLENEITGTSISYRLEADTTNSDVGYIPSTTAGKYVPIAALDVSSESCTKCGTTVNGEVFDAVQGSALGTVTTYNDDGTVALNAVQGLKLGAGYFAAGSTNAQHIYTLKVYFIDDGNNQDYDEDKDFEAYITLSAGDINTEILDSFTAVNSQAANELPAEP